MIDCSLAGCQVDDGILGIKDFQIHPHFDSILMQKTVEYCGKSRIRQNIVIRGVIGKNKAG
jgi:hypothetical protein